MPSYRALVPMRWSDMDIYRHINNVQIVRLLEDARVQAFSAWVVEAAETFSRAGREGPRLKRRA